MYVAARFEDMPLARAVAKALCAAGHCITSSWLQEDPNSRWRRIASTQLASIATTALRDVDAAEVVVILSSAGGENSGGKFVETGYAMATCKSVYLIGPRENAMMFHPNIQSFTSVDEVIDHLHVRRHSWMKCFHCRQWYSPDGRIQPILPLSVIVSDDPYNEPHTDRLCPACSTNHNKP